MKSHSHGMDPLRLLILIPEFPGQTHNFFWRELVELETRGVSVTLASTRMPPPNLASPAWASQAIGRTHYLMPRTFPEFLACLVGLLGAGPKAWGQCLHLIMTADVPSRKSRLRLAALALVAGRLRRIAERAGVHHLHAHSCADAANVALFARALGGPPYSLTLHGDLGGYGANQDAKWRHAAFALVVSETLRKSVRVLLKDSLPSRVEVAPMGVDVEFFQRRQPYVAWNGAGPLRLFSCARLNRHKGHACAVQVVRGLVMQGIDATLVVAGEDDVGGSGYRRELEQVIAEAGMGQRVILLGAVPAARVREGLEDAHAFLLLSEDEALGVAYMEAMAMEVPVLGCRVGGVPELVEDGQHGRLVAPGEPELARQALLSILESPGVAVRQGVSGRAKVLRHFSSGRSAEMLVQLVTSIHA